MKTYKGKLALSREQVEIWKIREKKLDEVKEMPLRESLKYIATKAEKDGNEFRKKIADEKKRNYRRKKK